MADIKIMDKLSKEEKTMKEVYCETLMELAGKNENIVAFDADLMNSSGMMPFKKAFPDRAIDCGIQEANMFGVAAGLSTMGMIPFIHTFGVFASRRIADQVYISGGYAKTNVRIVGTDPGIMAALNGATHMAMEDAAILRSVPGITIVEPTDCAMLEDLLRQTADLKGIFYFRLARKQPCKIYEKGSRFDIGKSVRLIDGKDVTIFAAGLLVEEALKAAEMLKNEGISAAVEDMFTFKPADKEAVIKAAKETGAIVTAENHNIIGGLGSAVAEVLVENCPVPCERVGIEDVYGEVGTVDYLKERFGLTAEKIAEKAKKAIARKNG